MGDGTRRVWSSDGGRQQEENAAKGAPAGDGVVRISRESKGRRGKTVTIVRGLALEPRELTDLAAELKKRCGVGGSAKDGIITIQGDKVDLVMAELERRGITAKRAGG